MNAFDPTLLKQIIEGLLLACNEPLSVKRMMEIFNDPEGLFPVAEKPLSAEVQTALEELQANSVGRGYELVEVASGWRFQVRQNLSPWVSRLWDERPVKYSRAVLETLALIAYRQPITRGDIEEIRGVAVSTNIIKTLMERQWVRVVGHRDVPGRPALYATTRQFLDYFNLKSLEELPSLAEIRDIDKINAELDFNQEQELAEQLAPKLAAQVSAELEEDDIDANPCPPDDSADPITAAPESNIAADVPEADPTTDDAPESVASDRV